MNKRDISSGIKPGYYYTLLEVCGKLWIYALLLAGAIIFSWPFLWMGTTTVKADREMFGEKIHLLPQRPVPVVRSPYVDTRYFRDIAGQRMKEALPLIEARLHALDYPWPAELDRDDCIRQTARGVYRKLVLSMPLALWQVPADSLSREISVRTDSALVTDILDQVRRSLALGQLLARSHDMQDDLLVTADKAAQAWTVTGTDAEGVLRQQDVAAGALAELQYRFKKSGSIRLTQTFTTSFPIRRLHKLQLDLRNDDSWHALDVIIEKEGKEFRSTRSQDINDFNWIIAGWQEWGAEDSTNKIKSWNIIKQTAQGPQFESRPNAVKITLVLSQRNAVQAWIAKVLRNYRKVFDAIPFARYVGTSLFLVMLSVVGALFSCSLVAYSFTRLRWPGRNLSFMLMLATLMIPPQVTMIPQFLIMRWLGLYNTLVPLWIGSFFASAFNVFLLCQFMRGIPRDLEDAAKIDGCGYWRIYWHIILPTVKPTLATIAIFTFMGTWNDFMGPLIYLSDQRLYPLSLGLFALSVQNSQAGGGMGIMMAGSLLMTLPVIIIFFFAQRYFIQGIALTGQKG